MTSSKSSENWQLSAYELQRLPHELVTDDTEVIVREERYVPDFTCPICFGVFRKTVATTGCLHRFCEECITTSLRKCNKECPTCRRKLVSKRSLRRDYRMDAMIAALLPTTTKMARRRPSARLLRKAPSFAEARNAVFQSKHEPWQGGRVSQAFAADGVARKGSDYGLTSRRAEGPQEPNAGARRVDAEILGEVDEVKARWKNPRDSFRRVFEVLHHVRKSGADAEDTKIDDSVKTLLFCARLLFLKDTVVSRP
ncbi:hypothetical protein HPB49_009662 [Dermacentor silvarum]|uniref:Uncharacterized protein n=1 Tax=Dermacentor silvarum TaxID=543639 RepID=A0ACB8DYS9_DERSI|nr:hypothetical protein HPB49_009662 [Dermacentor silvarum]